MKISILSCGVFEPELNKILNEINAEKLFSDKIEVKYLPFGLHTNLDKLKSEIIDNLSIIKSDKIILLYGCKCHYLFHEFLKDYDNIITFDDSNCIELIIKDESKKNILDDKNLYITSGWVLKFDELNRFMNSVDMYDIRQQYGRYDNIIIGNTDVCNFTDDMIFDLFEKIQVPIEIEKVDINVFKNKIINSINKAINS